MLGPTSADHDEVDPAEALMREVGAQLRQVRLDRGEDLDDVAQHLRIRSAYLFGLEQGDLSALPGRTYALGFLRSYADYLGFDGDDLIGRIKSSVSELTDGTRLRIRAPMPENRLPRTPMVVISLAVVAGIYLGWSYVNRSSRTVTDIIAEVPGSPRELAGLSQGAGDGTPAIEALASNTAAVPDQASGASDPDAPTRSAMAEAPAAPSDDGQASSSAAASTAELRPQAGTGGTRSIDSTLAATDEPAPRPDPSSDDQLARDEREALAVRPAAGGEPIDSTPTGRSPLGAESATTQPSASAVDQAETPAAGANQRQPVDPARQAVARLLDRAARQAEGPSQVYERTNTDARVILRAREPTWIQVSSPAGDYTFTRTLEPGEALLVPNRPDLELWTGNAGGLEIIVDGTAMVLPRGRAVRRNVSLDPERLLALSDQAR